MRRAFGDLADRQTRKLVGETVVDVAMVGLVGAHHQHDVAQRGILRETPVALGDFGRGHVRAATLVDLGDVSCLWMREFYLELCKRVQFPISMSLPAILIDHVLSAGNGQLMPMLMQPFDAYTDAAHLALLTHEAQHLYVEIEAEANLLFDQVLY